MAKTIVITAWHEVGACSVPGYDWHVSETDHCGTALQTRDEAIKLADRRAEMMRARGFTVERRGLGSTED